MLRLRRYQQKLIKNRRFKGGGSVTAKFSRSRGRPPRTIFVRIDRPVNALEFIPASIHTKKLYSRLSSSEVQFYADKGRFAFLSLPLAGLGVTYDVHLRLIGKRVVDFLLVLIELFREVLRLRRCERISTENPCFCFNRVLVWRQQMHGSRKCCNELAQLTVDDIWQIADAGNEQLRRLAHSSRRGTYWYDNKLCDRNISPQCFLLACSLWSSSLKRKQVSLDVTPSKCIPPPQKCIRSRYDLDLWPLTLSSFSPMPTQVMNICVKFHWNLSTKYRDIASLDVGVSTDRRTDGQPKNIMLSTYCCWRRHEKLANDINLRLESWLGLGIV